MTTIYNGQQQLDLMRAIALRALQNASGDNCYCPVQKPTKFIVTLKPVIKVPGKDPFLNLKQKSSSDCTCGTSKLQKKPTTDQIQVRNNNQALKGQTPLNAFRVLTNSKFITIDPKYDYNENSLLSPSRRKFRLTGGGHEAWETNENNGKIPRGQSRFLQPGQEKVKLAKHAKKVRSKESHETMPCQNERIHRILQHNCYEKNSTRRSLKCRIVCHGEHANMEKRKELKRERDIEKKPVEPTKDREELRRELEKEPEETEVPPPPLIPPGHSSKPECAEKSVGTSDEPVAAMQQQKTVDVFGWDPLKYFGLTCTGAKKTENEEKCEERQPCPLAMFPFPNIKKPEKIEQPSVAQVPPADVIEPCHAVKEERPACHERKVYISPEAQQPLQTVKGEHIPRYERQPHKEITEPQSPDISHDIIAHQCNRIHNLELQVRELRRELGRMRTEIIPPDDMLRCTALTSKLRELTALLADLKNRHAEAIAAVVIAKQQANQSRKNDLTPLPQPQPQPQAAPPPRPQMKAETVQTCFPSNHIDQLSQTTATFGWRPFIDEGTQSSQPSTVPVTPKHTSSVPISSLENSAASSHLPCRHGTGEIPLKESPSFCPYCQQSEYPCCTYVEENLCSEIMALLDYHRPCEVLLSVLLQPNNLYHINISVTNTGEPLGCIYATEHAINEAVEAEVFDRFLTFFIVDARISVQQKDKILAHTFEFFKN